MPHPSPLDERAIANRRRAVTHFITAPTGDSQQLASHARPRAHARADAHTRGGRCRPTRMHSVIQHDDVGGATSAQRAATRRRCASVAVSAGDGARTHLVTALGVRVRLLLNAVASSRRLRSRGQSRACEFFQTWSYGRPRFGDACLGEHLPAWRVALTPRPARWVPVSCEGFEAAHGGATSAWA